MRNDNEIYELRITKNEFRMGILQAKYMRNVVCICQTRQSDCFVVRTYVFGGLLFCVIGVRVCRLRYSLKGIS